MRLALCPSSCGAHQSPAGHNCTNPSQWRSSGEDKGPGGSTLGGDSGAGNSLRRPQITSSRHSPPYARWRQSHPVAGRWMRGEQERLAVRRHSPISDRVVLAMGPRRCRCTNFIEIVCYRQQKRVHKPITTVVWCRLGTRQWTGCHQAAAPVPPPNLGLRAAEPSRGAALVEPTRPSDPGEAAVHLVQADGAKSSCNLCTSHAVIQQVFYLNIALVCRNPLRFKI